jgi:diacylglycerol kinase (ATP)
MPGSYDCEVDPSSAHAGAQHRTGRSVMTASTETDTRTIVLIANPDARACEPELCAARLGEAGAEVEIFDIGEVDRAVRAGADRVALAGGDGSIAPVAAATGRAGVPLALIPAGTANDFARRLGLPLELSAACELAVRGSRLRALELGWMEPLAAADGGKRPFVNVASAGLPAPAAAAAKSWKRRLGPLAYAAGAVAAGVTASPIACTVECDDRVLFDGEAWQITVAASGAFGAGSRIDEADPTDGVLDVVAVEAGPRPRRGQRPRSGSARTLPRGGPPPAAGRRAERRRRDRAVGRGPLHGGAGRVPARDGLSARGVLSTAWPGIPVSPPPTPSSTSAAPAAAARSHD